jgi:hypothetical protein
VTQKDAEICHDCGATEPRTSLDGVWLCDRCADRQVAVTTGHPGLPDPPDPLEMLGGDGRRHVLTFRIGRAPTGIEVELEESGVPIGEGYHFAVLGAHDASLEELVTSVREQAGAEISRQYLEPNPHRPGRIIRDDEVAGRFIWSEANETGGPYNVVVDGCTLTWEELGEALEPFEGWRFRLVIEDRTLVSYSCHWARNRPLIRAKTLFNGLYPWWRWRESNPRPPEFQ